MFVVVLFGCFVFVCSFCLFVCFVCLFVVIVVCLFVFGVWVFLGGLKTFQDASVFVINTPSGQET